jgi:uncharacterized protein
VAGAVLGARILLRVPHQKLRMMFIGILVILAIQMLLTAFGINLLGSQS